MHYSKLTLIGLGLFALGSLSSQAATVRFEPAGSQLDGDTILDIVLLPGQPITFSNFFDNSNDTTIFNLPNPTRFIDYTVTYDATELTYVSSSLDVNNKISDSCNATLAQSLLNGVPPNCGSTITTGVGTLTVTHKTAVGNLVTPQVSFLLDQITFVGANVNPWPGDGLSDYSFTGSNRGLLGGTISNFTSNTVEVQAVPAPLPLLGAGVAFGSFRRIKKLSGQLKTLTQG